MDLRQQAINKGGTIEVAGIGLTLTHANHSSSVFADGQFVYTGEACGYVVELEDGFKLYFSGDTNVFGDLSLIGRIYTPDLAVLPIGDHYTMGPREASVAIELLGVVPLRPLPLRDVPPPDGDPGRASEARTRWSPDLSLQSPESSWPCDAGALVRLDRPPSTGGRPSRTRSTSRARSSSTTSRTSSGFAPPTWRARRSWSGRRSARGGRERSSREARSPVRSSADESLLDLDLAELTYG